MREMNFPLGSVRDEFGKEILTCFREGGPWQGGIIQGPIESGKSVAAAGLIMSAMCSVPRWRKGIRKSKWLVCRNSYPDLETSTIPTWLHWFPEEAYGKFSWSEPYTHKMKFLDVEAEVVFRSFGDDSQDTLKALRSTEWTGAWINEGQFIPRRLFMEMSDRTGRYPPVHDGGSGRKFIVMDMNAPQTEDHWVLRMRGDVELPEDMPESERFGYVKPSWLKFYMQPPALLQEKDITGKHLGWKVNPKAENLENMKPERYLQLAEGKTMDEVRRDLCNEVVIAHSGAPCFPGYDKDRHATMEPIKGYEGAPLILGFDWGATPACTVWQQVQGQWLGLGELVETNCLIVEFAPKVKRFLSERWPWALAADGPGIVPWGDPEGDWRNEQTGKSHFDILQAKAGFRVKKPAQKDNPQFRLNIGRQLMKESLDDGRPRLLISRHPQLGMPRLHAALSGGYVLKTMKVDGTEKLKSEVVKNNHSHVAEAACYAWWGGGEGAAMMGIANAPKRVNTREIARKTGRRRAFAFGSR